MCRPAVCASRRARFVRCSAVRPAVDKPNSGTGQRRRGRPPPRHCGAAGTRQRRGPRASSSGEVVWSRRTFICFLRIRGSCVSCFLLLYLRKYVLSKCVMVGALLLYVLKYAYQVFLYICCFHIYSSTYISCFQIEREMVFAILLYLLKCVYYLFPY